MLHTIVPPSLECYVPKEATIKKGNICRMSIDAIQEIERSETIEDDILLEQIEALDKSLIEYFPDTLVVDNALTRKLVSFQANKARGYYRWYKYKEAFSADLVEYLFRKYRVVKGKILDPFAGAGTALFGCSSLGYHSDGIEDWAKNHTGKYAH